MYSSAQQQRGQPTEEPPATTTPPPVLVPLSLLGGLRKVGPVRVEMVSKPTICIHYGYYFHLHLYFCAGSMYIVHFTMYRTRLSTVLLKTVNIYVIIVVVDSGVFVFAVLM